MRQARCASSALRRHSRKCKHQAFQSPSRQAPRILQPVPAGASVLLAGWERRNGIYVKLRDAPRPAVIPG